MKKIFIFLITFFTLIISPAVNATEEEFHKKATFPIHAQTYVQDAIMSIGFEADFEERLTNSWSKLEDECKVSDLGITVSEIEVMFQKVHYNNPRFYYVNNYFEYFYNADGIITRIISFYSDDKATVEKNMKALDDATEEILLCINGNMSDFDKIMTVHDYMVLNYHYDKTGLNHSILIMTGKEGVCSSYAFAFKYMMDILNIECTYVSSTEMNHMWNLVKLKGKWYHIDLTWDDPSPPLDSPVYDQFAQVHHEYALLSTDKIKELNHYGFDIGNIATDSTEYDNAAWHSGISSVVYCCGEEYWIEDNDLVCSNGKTIYKNLDGNDNDWDISNNYIFPGLIYAGIAEYNGSIYFNTEKKVFCYNTKTQKTTQLLSAKEICGLYIDKNILKYCAYDHKTSSFSEAGSIKLSDIRFGTPYISGSKLIAKIYKDSPKKMMVISFGNNHAQVTEIIADGVSTVTFDADNTQALYFWDENMMPLKAKEILSK